MLTPVQHAQIRRHIFLIPAYLFALYAWGGFFVNWSALLPPVRVQELSDFAHFYVQGVIANEHNEHALYNINDQGAILKRVVPGNPDLLFPPVQGPQVSLAFAPFARVPYEKAAAAWLAISAALYLLCGYFLWRACAALRAYPWPTFVLLIASPALRSEVEFGQTSAVSLACLTAAFFAFRRDRRFVAGLALGVLAYKPQLGFAAACVFLAAGEWTVVAGAVAAAAVQLVAGAVYWGPSILANYANALRHVPQYLPGLEPDEFMMHSWRSFFDLIGLPPAVALGAYVAAAFATLVVARKCWRSPAPLTLRFAAVVIAIVLIDPHLWVYDLLLLTPAFLFCADWLAMRGNISGKDFMLVGLLYFCYFSPIFGNVTRNTRVQVSVLALMAVLLALSTRIRRSYAAA